MLIGEVSISAEGGDKVLGVEPGLIESALVGKELLFRRQYDQAYALFDKLEKEYPDSPTGLAGKMAAWQVKMFEHDDFRFKSQFEAAEKEYAKFSHKRLRKGDVPSWDLFVYGAADGMRGFFKTREEKWWGALSNALHAVRMLKQLKWREPDLVDLDLGLGAYKYWRSVVTNEIKFLPFFGDHRKEGIQLLERAAAEGKYATDLALANLVYIYGDSKDYDKAFKTADRLLSMYPQNIIVRYLKGKFSLWAGKYDQALAIFKQVYEMNPSIYKALLYQGIVLCKKGDMAEARTVFDKYLGVEKEEYGRAVAYYWLGRIAEAGKDNPTAISYYEKSLKLYNLKPARARLRHCRSR